MTTSSPTWVFDGSPLPDPLGYGERAVRFLKKLKHPKSRALGRPFEVWPFMERIVRRVYGDTDENGLRRAQTVFLMLPRGNRKTTLGGGLALLHTCGPEQVPGGYNVVAAADREQARIAFAEARMIKEEVQALDRALRINRSEHKILHPKSGSIFHALSSDGRTKHGSTPAFILADELHAWSKTELWEALRTGMAKTPGSILWVITTAGRGRMNLCWPLYEYARKIQDGLVDDPGFLPILFESPADVDWRSEAAWRAVNPGLAHGFPDLRGLRQLAREAEERPADREAFRQFHLNVWLDGSAAPWVEMSVYDEGAAAIDEDALNGEPCWIGVDLSSVEDLTAVVAAFRAPGGGYIVLPRFFVPEATLRKRQERDKLPYLDWAERGFLIATPGNVVDHDAVVGAIVDMAGRFRVMEVAIDRWNSTAVTTRLSAAGIPVVQFGQGFASMAAPIKELERAILSRSFQHGGHPVLRWNFGNVAVEQDAAGNRKFTKAAAAEKIDGAVATVMAIGRAFAADTAPSIYEGRDLMVL